MTLAVTLHALAGSPPTAGLCAALGREGVALVSGCDLASGQLTDAADGLGEVPSTPLALVWLPAAAPEAELERIVRRRSSSGRAGAILGCAPDGSDADSERALAVGFDDFVAGRGSPRELAGRLRALARRLLAAAPTPGRLGVGRLTLDAAGHDLWIDDRRVRLTRLESRTLAALMCAPGLTLSRNALLDRVWGEGSGEASPRAVDNLVQRLRRKLGDPELVVTIRGLGFRLRAADG